MSECVKGWLFVVNALVVFGLVLLPRVASTEENVADRDRFGLLEDCSSAEGWQGAKVTSDGRHLVVEDRIARGGRIRKAYGAVDLDRYHYAVVNIVQKSMPIRISINGVATPLGYTTGLTAVDLKNYKSPQLAGKRAVTVGIWFGGRSRAKQAIDWFGLAESLTQTEKTALAPYPLNWREEKLVAKPYHSLEALKARSNLPLADQHEQAIFRDTATGGIITRLTASPASEFLDELPCWGSFGYPWNADGSCFKISCGRGRTANLIDLHKGVAFEGFFSPRILWNPGDPQEMYVLRERTQVFVYNWVTKKRRLLCRVNPTERGWVEFWFTYKSNKIMYSMRTRAECFVIDPKAPKGRRVRRYGLRNLKLAHLGGEDEKLLVWNSQGGEGIMCRDLATGKEAPGHVYSTSHSPHGRYANIERHSLLTMLYVPRQFHHTFNYTPGDRVKIWAHYAKPFFSDYGALTEDEQWVFTNGYHRPGRAGDLLCQHLQISGKDPGTVLRLARFYTSYRNHTSPRYSMWDCPTYSRQSPDYTKLVYVEDVLGNPDLWVVYTRRPDPVKNLRITRKGGGAELAWGRPSRSREIRHYNVYWTDKSGRDYRRINTAPVTKLSYDVPARLANGFFAVAPEEHCRLEGLYSDEVSLESTEATRYIEAPRCALVPPARMVFDGNVGDFRYVRVTPLAPQERTAVMKQKLLHLPAGRYSVWMRVRGKGSWAVAVDGKDVGSVASSPQEWKWAKLQPAVELKPGSEISFSSGDVDLCCDRAVLSSAARFAPKALEPRDTTPPQKPEGFAAQSLGARKVKLSWKPLEDPDFHHFSLYVGTDPNFMVGNETIIRSLYDTEIVDAVPREENRMYYKLVAYDQRGNASEAAVVVVNVR